MKLRSNNRQLLKTTMTLLKVVIVGLSSTILISLIFYSYFYLGRSTKSIAANPTFTTVAEKTNNWESGSSWVGGSLPSSGADYVIDGTTTRNGNISLANFESLTINTGDTLIITGDLSLANKAILTVMDKAVLIVRGNYDTQNQSADVVQSGGTMVILGTISFTGGGADITANPGSKVYYDRTQNPTAASKITGGGTVSDISALPASLYPPTYGNLLPVSVKSFIYKIEKENVLLTWEVEEESGIKDYVVQRSTDGIKFNTISKVLPYSNNESSNTYSFTDVNTFSGNSFYRIQLDNDEKIIYKNIIKVNVSNKAGIIIYPNTSDGSQMGFMGNDIQNKLIAITIYDPSGREVFADKIEVGNTDQYSVNFLSKLHKGKYFVHFSYDNRIEKKSLLVGE